MRLGDIVKSSRLASHKSSRFPPYVDMRTWYQDAPIRNCCSATFIAVGNTSTWWWLWWVSGDIYHTKSIYRLTKSHLRSHNRTLFLRGHRRHIFALSMSSQKLWKLERILNASFSAILSLHSSDSRHSDPPRVAQTELRAGHGGGVRGRGENSSTNALSRPPTRLSGNINNPRTDD